MHIVGTIGFEQPTYTVREGVDTSAEVCFRILSPEVSQLDILAFALVNVVPMDGSALGNQILVQNAVVMAPSIKSSVAENNDYVIPPSYSDVSVLDSTVIRDCKTVDLVDDNLEEPSESFTFRLTLSSNNVIGNFQVVFPETTVLIQDDDRVSPGKCCN